MEDDLRPVEIAQAQEPPRLAHIRNLRGDLEVRPPFAQFAVEEVEIVLVDVDQNESLAAIARDLPGDLSADRARRSRYEDALAGHETPDLLGVEDVRFTRQ